jgi:serine/threonine protein kinase
MVRTFTCQQGHAFEIASDVGNGDPPTCPVCAGRAAPTLPMSGPTGSVKARPSEPLPRFTGFEIIEELSAGVGGMGTVYKAREKTLDRVVALKVVKPRLNTREGMVYFEREAQAAARLDHPNILKVFGFHPEHEPPFFVMQCLEGRSIAEACRGRDYEFIAELMEKVARAVA